MLTARGAHTALSGGNFDFKFWEKNWMPFVHDGGRLLAVRWFSPHTIVEVDPRSGVCQQLHATPHGFAHLPFAYSLVDFLTIFELA